METTVTKQLHRRPCKKCKHGVLDSRLKRPFLIKTLLFWLPLRLYKCNVCNRKTYVLGSGWVASKETDSEKD